MAADVHKIICSLRKKAGLTQEQLGMRLGVSGQAVSKWETGESLPDILLLPELCSILGISADTLLGVSGRNSGTDEMERFCAYARKQKGSAVLLEALSRLYNDGDANCKGKNTDFGPDRLKVYDGGGMGFIMRAGYGTACLKQKGQNVDYFLRVLTDETCLQVMRYTSMNIALTREDLVREAELEEESLDRALVELMNRNILCCDVDSRGKRGYLHSWNMAGAYMVLAGCMAVNCGGELQGNLWFTRSNPE